MHVEIEGNTERAARAVAAIQKIDRPAEEDQLDAAAGLLRLRQKRQEIAGTVSNRE